MLTIHNEAVMNCGALGPTLVLHPLLKFVSFINVEHYFAGGALALCFHLLRLLIKVAHFSSQVDFEAQGQVGSREHRRGHPHIKAGCEQEAYALFAQSVGAVSTLNHAQQDFGSALLVQIF